MGGGASSTRAGIQYVKVEVLPGANTGGRSSGLWPSRDIAGASFRIDEAGVIVGCSAKVIESLTEGMAAVAISRGEGGAVLVPDGTMARVDSSLGNEFEDLCGFKQGSQVPRHVFADKSHSQLLVAKSPMLSSNSARGGSKQEGKEDKNGAPASQYYVVPRLEPFSRISGICKILGDRECPSKEKHALRVGDFVRVGSVGLVVTETSTSLHNPPDSITAEQLWYLKPRAFAVVTPHDAAAKRLCGQAIISEPGSSKAPRPPPPPSPLPSSSAPTTVLRARRRLVGDEGKDEGGDAEGKYSGEEGKDSGDDENVGLAEGGGGRRNRDVSDSDDEEGEPPLSPSTAAEGLPPLGSARGGGGEDKEAAEEETAMCYVCCDDDVVTADNPLVSACSCLGGTRWLHLKCLQRLLGSTGPQGPCVVFRNQNRNLICRVCRAEYLKQVELQLPPEAAGPGGKPAAAPGKMVVIPIPQPSMRPPYICFKVVTHNAHNTFQDSIFNSFYHVSFAPLVDSVANEPNSQPPPLPRLPLNFDGEDEGDDGAGGAAAAASAAAFQPSDEQAAVPNARRPLVLGRSMDSDMQLNYQTVSGHHAALYYEGGQFSIQDLRSSNGTFVYLKEPLPLPPSSSVRIRMGRKTLRLSSVEATVKGQTAASSKDAPLSSSVAEQKDEEEQAAVADAKEPASPPPPPQTAALGVGEASSVDDTAFAKETDEAASGYEGSGGIGERTSVGNLPTLGRLKTLMVVERPSARPPLSDATIMEGAHDGAYSSPPRSSHTPLAAGARPYSAPSTSSTSVPLPEVGSIEFQLGGGGGQLQQQEVDDNEEDEELEARTPRLVPGSDGPVLTLAGGDGNNDSNPHNTNGGGAAQGEGEDAPSGPPPSSSSSSVMQAVRGTFTRVTLPRP